MAELEAALLLTTPINIADDAEVGTRDGVKLIDGAAVGLTVGSDVMKIGLPNIAVQYLHHQVPDKTSAPSIGSYEDCRQI